MASWDLRGRAPYTQQVLSHPVVNVVFTGEPSLVRVDALVAGATPSVRQLQRRFADHVRVSAKALLRRYRLY